MAVSKKLNQRIMEVLACAGKKGLSLRELLSKLKVKEQELKDVLKELIRYGIVELWHGQYRFSTAILEKHDDKKRKKSKKGKKPDEERGPDVITPPGIGPPPINIAVFVATSKQPPSVSEVAEALDLDSSKVYQVCRRFEKNKLFKKGEPKQSTKRIYFAPAIGKSVNSGNYALINRLYRQVRKPVSQFELGDKRLEQNLRKSFAEILKKKEYGKYRKEISSFREQLLRVVRGAEAKKDVYEFLGLKPYYPKVSTWKSAV